MNVTPHTSTSAPVKAVRTVSATKATFFSAYPRPINSVYRRVVEELLVELHLATVKSNFVYDPFFALGVVTVFNALMEAYRPEPQRQPIYVALCKALQMKPDSLTQDAQKLRQLLGEGDPQQRLQLLQQQPEAEDVGGLRRILERMRDPQHYAYSRIVLLGLYTAYEEVATPLYPDLEERTRVFFETVSQPLGFAEERVRKDLELYRNSLDKMQQARAVVEEMVKAARRQQERRTTSGGSTAKSGDGSSASTESAESAESAGSPETPLQESESKTSN